MFVGRIDEAAKPVVNELLCQGACLHIGIHIDVGHLEALVLQHGLHGDDVRMHLTPRERLNGGVNDIGTIVADLQDRSHGESGAGVSVILDEDVGVLGLDALGQGTEHGGLTDTCHVLQADFLGTGSYQLVGNVRVVLNSVHGTGGDAERGLGYHASLLGPLDGGDDVTCVVQTAEDAGYVNTLGMLDLVHQGSHVVGHRIHAKGIQTAVEHVRLDAYLVKRFAESAYGMVGVLARHEIHLFKGTAVGFHTGKAPHVDDGRSHTFQLVLAGLELTRRLPHVTIDKAELNLLFHTLILLSVISYLLSVIC